MIRLPKHEPMKPYTLLTIAFISLLFFSCQPELQKPLQVSTLFSHHMVLQQNKEVAFWGQYTPAKKITVTGSWGEETTAISDASGQWETRLQGTSAGGPHTIRVISKDSTIIIDDVLFGEVWIASGQSNMEMPLKGWPPNDTIQDSEEEIAMADHPGIRMFTVPRMISVSPLDSVQGEWVVATPQTAGDFSASAYFFAKRLQNELNVPVGIIHTSWGGTVAEAWTSSQALRELGDFNETLDLIGKPETFDLVNKWFDQWPTKEFPNTEEAWQTIDFSDLDAAKSDFDDSNWAVTTLPGRIDQLGGIEFDGAVWLRKEFDLSEVTSDYTLHIGSIDDMDATFVNGQKVGGLAGAGYWNVPRAMEIPRSLLKKGKNTIAIRVIDTGGGGSVDGPLILGNQNDSISLAGVWKQRLIAEIYMGKFYIYDLKTSVINRPDFLQLNPNLPAVLFNAMINPLVPYTIKGAIWYQGESNVGRDEQYKRLFPAMIKDWRAQWNDEFPFYFVQIAPFVYNPDPALQESQKLRDAQRFSLLTPNTGMVVTLDIGNPDNIHPANKKDVGSRLAGLALANNYGKNIVASGPLYKGIKKAEGKLLVEFDFTGSGLMCPDQVLAGFEIAGADKVYVAAQARITEGMVEVSHPEITAPEYVRYAWRDDSAATLFNAEGLPASSFSSE